MIKKEYISPVVELLDVESQKLLAGSVTDEGDINVDDPVSGDAGDAAAPGFESWNVLWTIVVLLMMSLTVSAQSITTIEPAGPSPDGKTHGMTIYLKNGTTVEYDFDDLSHVTYLPGIGMKVYKKNETMSVDYLYSQMIKVD